MRVIVIGATGNLGTSVLRSLQNEDQVESILGLARRLPRLQMRKVEWAVADITKDDLVPYLRGADAVVLLAWLKQPSRDLNKLWMNNVEGSIRATRAVEEAGVPVLLYASSIGTYSPAPKDRAVDESWPVAGIATLYYSRQKAEVERRLDRFQSQNPDVRVVRFRPAPVFKRESAEGIRRLLGGPLLPGFMARPEFINLVPEIQGLRFQAVHSYDVGEAYRLALLRDVRGAFNLAAGPVLDAQEIGRLLNARPVPVPTRLVRAGARLSWQLRLQPAPEGWLDIALNFPIMDTSRARQELGWTPAYSSEDAFLDLLEGLRRGAGLDTPPLSPKTGGPFRIREVLTGVGKREP
jgi:UDP-glucose 4-epimerase